MREISASNIARAEDLLPCGADQRFGEIGYLCHENSEHDRDCPAYHRPAVSQALQDKDDRIAELEKALEPFAKLADKHPKSWPNTRWIRTDVRPTIGDLRKARSALSPQKTGEAS